MNHIDYKDFNTYCKAKDLVLSYPHYTTEHRNLLLDAIDDAFDTQRRANENAREILNRILLEK